jgi:hypothetical protein
MIRLTSLLYLLFALSLAAEQPAIPDFSKGMPDVNLERKEKVNKQENFYFKTALSSKEFSAALNKFLGAGWGKKKLSEEEMDFAMNLARTSNVEINLAVYRNDKIPGVDIRVIHMKQKERVAKYRVEISVIRVDPK